MSQISVTTYHTLKDQYIINKMKCLNIIYTINDINLLQFLTAFQIKRLFNLNLYAVHDGKSMNTLLFKRF